MNEEDRKQGLKWILWINLFVGFYNIYLWNIGGDWFWNLVIGCLNIGIWVFFRKI